MPVSVAPTPNPNAAKFSVGAAVGGPATFVVGANPEDPMAAGLLGIAGVTSIFMTADFVTISKAPDTPWESIIPEATAILESRFGA
jgi:Scaffold protein Nfu/NifU N terminal